MDSTLIFLNVFDESPKSEVFDLGVEEVDSMDFVGIENILSNSPNNDFEEFYTVEENFIFKREEIVDPFLGGLYGAW